MKRLLACAAALALLALAPALSASADEVDLFQDLDTAMAGAAQRQEQASEDKDLADQLRDNLDVAVRLRGYQFMRTAGDDYLKKDKQDTYGELRLQYYTAYANQDLRFATSGWIEGGNQEDTYAGVTETFQDMERRRNVWEINEVYGAMDLGEVDVTMGRRVVENGIATLFSPSNRYSGLDLNDPLDPRRLGVWQVSADMTLGDADLTFTVMPFFSSPKTPSIKSRWVSSDAWAGIPGYFGADESMFDEFLAWLHYFSSLSGVDLVGLFSQFFDFNFGATTPLVTVEYDKPDADDPDQWGYLGQAKTTLGNYDLFASLFRGPSIYPVLKAKLDTSLPAVHVTVEHPITSQVAGGASTTWKELEFHGEALYSSPEDGKDDTYVQYVGGSTWSNQSVAAKLGLQRIDLTAEYAGEALMARQSAKDYFISSEYARLGRNDFIGRLDAQCTDDFSVHWMTDILLSNAARLHRIGVSWRLSEALTWKTDLELFDGTKTTYYGRWRDLDRIVTSLEYHF